MVRLERDAIERTYQAILALYEGSRQISISGRKANVDNAKSHIQGLLLSQRSSNNDATKDRVENNIINMGRVPIANTPEIQMPSNRMDVEIPLHINNQPSSPLNDQVVPVIPDTDGSEISNSSQSFSLDGDDLCEDSSSLSDINRQLSIQAEQDYSDNLKFALKLGYSEVQIKSAVAKLGVKASADQILSELIKLAGNSRSSNSEDELSVEKLYISSESDTTSPPPHGSKTMETPSEDSSNLRSIVIDGSNVAMSHGNKAAFSCNGIKLVVQWFKQRGHTEICVFVPQWRKETPRADSPIVGQSILTELEREKVLVFTPSRRVQGKRIVCYDDRYILKLAADNGGIVVSNDNYRDLVTENPEYREVVEKRLLMYSFVNDRFMPPDDPLGRRGPTLENFLRKTPTVPEKLPAPCPYGRKCTYGNKCKYYHPERGNMPHKFVSEKLQENAKLKAQEKMDKGSKDGDKKKSGGKKPRSKMALTRTQSLAPTSSQTASSLESNKRPVARTESDTVDVRRDSVPTITVSEDPEKLKQERAYNERLSLLRMQAEAADAVINEPYRNDDSHPARPERLVSGYLALAKKLSDESDDDKRQLKERGPRTKPAALPFNNDTVSGHTKLSRQFSLQGPQDPRLRPQYQQMYSLPGDEHGSYLPRDPNHCVQLTADRYARSISHQSPIREPVPAQYFTDNRVLSVDNSHPFSSNYNSTSINNQGYVAMNQNDHFLSDPTQYLMSARGTGTNSGQTIVNRPQATSSLPFSPEPAYEHLDGYVSRSTGIQPQHVHAADLPYAQQGLYQYQRVGMPAAQSVMQTGRQTAHLPSTPTMMTAAPTAGYNIGSAWAEPVPYTQTRYPDEAPIEVTDERYRLYYHLSNLYSERIVRAVMNRHPEERDVQILCGYITSLSY